MKKLLLFMLFAAMTVYAQVPNPKQVSKDTIKTVALQEFKVPGKSNLVLTNVMSVAFSAELLDGSGAKLRDFEGGNQFPDNATLAKMVGGGRGATVQYWLNETINNPGTYYVKINLNLRSEVGRKNRDVYYVVNVDYPTMASVINIYDKYLFSEKTTFSFATLEYGDPSLYSYDIQDAGGSVIESGEGPIVDLSKAFGLESNVGKVIRVVGKYNSEQFSYKVSAENPEVKSTSWEFNLSSPGLNAFTAWLPKDKAEGKDRFIYYQNTFSMQILFVFMEQNAKGDFIAVAPRARGLRVTSNPPLIKQGKGRTAGSFYYVDLVPDLDYIDNQMEEYGSEYVEIKVEFTDQFNKRQTKEYVATIIN